MKVGEVLGVIDDAAGVRRPTADAAAAATRDAGSRSRGSAEGSGRTSATAEDRASTPAARNAAQQNAVDLSRSAAAAMPAAS